ncbi:MAG: OmpA family protein [Deltaproteobacteria bacterium]|nr:OmpA family protein [Deltaproteobacteria bacterium]
MTVFFKRLESFTLIWALFFIVLPALFPQSVMSAEPYSGPLSIRLKYLFGFDGSVSGKPLAWVDQILVDNERGEVYLLDKSNRRIVVADFAGVYLYQIKFSDANLTSPSAIELDPRNGDIYVAEPGRVAQLSYIGVYKSDVNLSRISDKDKLNIQSIRLVPDAAGKGGTLYIGEGGKGRLIVINLNGDVIKEFGRAQGIGYNVKDIYVDNDNIAFIDPTSFVILRFGHDGALKKQFGTLSSLLGGFSMPSGLYVDGGARRIYVVDVNRMMVIVFDWDGNPLYEFGGPQIFSWPRAVAVDKNGHIYVADNSGTIRVFEVVEVKNIIVEEPPPIALPPAPQEPPQVVAPEPIPAPPPIVKDEVEKMVETEAKLLPVYFDTGSTSIKKALRDALDKNAEWLNKNPDVSVNVRGYADMRGSDKFNLELSNKRAKAVMKYLVSKGVDAKRMKVVSFGREMTINPNEETLAMSRRVDFFVVKQDRP